ncbi:MAG TPA: ABC transporter permease [Actinomycetaceae bacterium]|nr:ABC transporter permease [Actinomycetaceae bacterium]
MSQAERLSWGRFFGSEVRLMLGRRRNQIGLAVLAAVPVIMAVAIHFSGSTGNLLGLLSANGVILPLAAIAVQIAFFLPLAIALVAGDAVAGEANVGTLRYLLTVPVSRTRLLVVKYATIALGAVIATTLIAVVGTIAGVVILGAGPMTTLSGTELSFAESLGRLAIAVAYASLAIAAIGAIGLVISTLTESPVVATITLMAVIIVAWILEAIEQVSFMHPYLPTHYLSSFTGVLFDPIQWGDMATGAGYYGAVIVIFWLVAWAHFTTKDVTS